MIDRMTSLTIRVSPDEYLRWQCVAVRLNETSVTAFIRRVMADYTDQVMATLGPIPTPP